MLYYIIKVINFVKNIKKKGGINAKVNDCISLFLISLNLYAQSDTFFNHGIS